MKELIKVSESVNGRKIVSAKELHGFLNVRTSLILWCKRMFDYGFEEGVDYTALKSERSVNQSVITYDFALTLDCAKEISMVQRSKKGKQARQYFIECEKRLSKPKLMTQMEIVAHNAQMLLNQERAITDNSERIARLEASNTTRPMYFTIAGFATLNKMSVNLKQASILGRKASKECKEKGLKTDECPDPRFGIVKMYPQSVLENVFENYKVSA